MKKRAVFGDPSGVLFSDLNQKARIIKSVSSPDIPNELFSQERPIFPNSNRNLFQEEKVLIEKANKEIFGFDDKSTSTGSTDTQGNALLGFKRTASGLTRRNISSSNLTTLTSSPPTTSYPIGAVLSCPDLQEANKKQLRLERNRNAARLRRHKRRLVVETLSKEKNYMELSLSFISSLKQTMNDEYNPDKLFGLSDIVVTQILNNNKTMQDHISYLIQCSDKNYRSNGNDSKSESVERSLMSTIIGTPLEGKSWCPKMKQNALQLYLFHQRYQAEALKKLGKMNVLISLLSQKVSQEEFWLTNEQKQTLKGLLKGIVAGQIRLKLLYKACNALFKRVLNGDLTVPFPLLENGMNAFRSVLTDEQLERFYRLAEETLARNS